MFLKSLLSSPLMSKKTVMSATTDRSQVDEDLHSSRLNVSREKSSRVKRDADAIKISCTRDHSVFIHIGQKFPTKALQMYLYDP